MRSLEEQLKHRPVDAERVAELKAEMVKEIPHPLWPQPDDYAKPVVKQVVGWWIVVVPDESPYVLDTFEEACSVVETYNRNLSESTEYTERREKLAEFLCDLVYGEGAWAEVDEDVLLNYRLDADDIIKANPHLLSLEERERLADQIPELAYP